MLSVTSARREPEPITLLDLRRQAETYGRKIG